jgi:hypothetical protein
LALDENYTVNNVTIKVAKSTPENLLVSLNGKTEITLDEVILQGSASKISEVKRQNNEGRLSPELFFNVAEYSWKQTSTYTLDVMSFLKENDFFEQLGVKIIDCSPRTININVQQLAKKELKIKCYNESLNELSEASVQPSTVQMYVPEYWGGDELTARIVLSQAEQQQGRISGVYKRAFVDIKIIDDQPKFSNERVRVSLPSQKSLLTEYLITSPRLGISLSPNLQGKYKVQVLNLNTVLAPISVKATPEAKKAYEDMHYQVELEIYDRDLGNIGQDDTLRRSLNYNLPVDFLREGQIELNQQPETARFKLTALEDFSEQD